MCEEICGQPQYKHPASNAIATGYGPCRVCLKTFEKGKEERILFTYNSFEGLSELPLPGPVFIHKEECVEYSDSGFPSDLIGLPLLFEAFGKESVLKVREPVNFDRIDEQISGLLCKADVEFLNIRNAEAGCYIARIER